jgi:integrase
MYRSRLREFFRQTNLDPDEFVQLASTNPKQGQRVVGDYIETLKRKVEAGSLAPISVTNFVSPVKLFCVQNDVMLNWEKVWGQLPRPERRGQDRAPSVDEIKRVVKLGGFREKAAFLIMASSGIRVGAWVYDLAGRKEPMRVKDIEPVAGPDGHTVAAKMRVYRGTNEPYLTFITPEAWDAFQTYLEDRRRCGELVTGESPIMRDKYWTSRGSGFRGSAKDPKALGLDAVRDMISDWETRAGVRIKTGTGRQYDFRMAHGFRKWFKTQAEKTMKSLNIEVLLGHNAGLAKNYYRPTEGELLGDYLKAVPDLTIMAEFKPIAKAEEVEDLRTKVRELAEDRDELVKEVNLLVEVVNRIGDLPTGKEQVREAKGNEGARVSKGTDSYE